MPQILDFNLIEVYAPSEGRRKLGIEPFDFSAHTTSELPEGSNLYWTQARFNTAFAKAIAGVPATPGFSLTADAPLAWDSVAHILSIPQASATQDGYLSAADFATFAAGGVPPTRLINTTAPLAGGGDLSADRTLSIPKATAAVDGYLAATDFVTFNSKVSTTRAVNTTAPLTGGGDLSADRTLAISAATATSAGSEAAYDFIAARSIVAMLRGAIYLS